MEQDLVIKVDNLKTYFYNNNKCNKAVNGVSFEIRKGKTLCVVGESGCGKSATASSIMQLLPELSRIEEGSIQYFKDDKIIELQELEKNGKEMRKIRGKEIAMIFQEPMTALNPVLKVGYQISESLRVHYKISKKEAKKKAIEVLSNMGIALADQRYNEYPHQYSGGMRQRAMIAMAMCCSPQVLIADEPTTALDVTIQAQIFQLMKDLQNQQGMAIMMITHDMAVVSELADDVAVMYMGNIVESGTKEEIFRNPVHPYTVALMNSIPVLGRGKTQNLQPIKGNTPSPYNRPKGCQFEPRCKYATDECKKMPEEILIAKGHKVRCWNYKKVLK